MQNFPRIISTLLLIAGVLTINSCTDSPKKQEPQPESSLADFYPKWSAKEISDRELRKKDQEPILRGIPREQYQNLDPFVAKFSEFYRDGISKRTLFYEVFALYRDLNGRVDALRWHPTLEKNMQTWSTMKPNSPVPTVGLACLYLNHAWLHRGGGWANEVTEEGWEGFRKYLDLAHQTLKDAPLFVREDPHYYRAMMRVALGKGLSVEETEGYFQGGQKVDPFYMPLYLEMTEFLQPRWYGEKGA